MLIPEIILEGYKYTAHGTITVLTTDGDDDTATSKAYDGGWHEGMDTSAHKESQVGQREVRQHQASARREI